MFVALIRHTRSSLNFNLYILVWLLTKKRSILSKAKPENFNIKTGEHLGSVANIMSVKCQDR